MNVILFRHAQKGLTPFDNPHLTQDGFAQAEAIAAAVLENKLPVPTEIWVSEKIRTTQTLQVVARQYKISCEEKHQLDLRRESETQKTFRTRVENLIQQLSVTNQKDSSLEAIYLCTHYDWIEEAMSVIPSDTDLTTFHFSHWGPAQYAQFQIENGLWKFIKKGTFR